MKISELGGETALINLIQEHYGVTHGGDLELGIGDDAALVKSGDRFLIITADLLVENTHFRMNAIDPYLLGWKSAAVNISDVAAMGGTPTFSFVSIGLPDTEVSVVEDIYEGMRDVSSKYGSVIAGGDTVGSEAGIVINVTQLGEVEPELAARRSGAEPGDAIIVTNTLGDSRAGLVLLLKFGLDQAKMISSYLVERHLKPEPRVEEARAAVATGAVKAMMDLSDGLAADLPKLCKASGVGARVYGQKLPISDQLRAAAETGHKDPVEIAEGGGEDYELLITCDPDNADAVVGAIINSGSRASIIGDVVPGNEVTLVSSEGVEKPLGGSWEHF